MEKFCPRCGKETDSLFGGLCAQCFAAKKKPFELPKEVKVQYCKKCGKLCCKGKWFGESEEVLEKIVLEKLKVKGLSKHGASASFSARHDGSVDAIVSVVGLVGSEKMSFEQKVLLKKSSVLCDPCMKLSSDYFEATVQLRFGEKPPAQKVKELVGEAEKFLEKLRERDSLAGLVAVAGERKGVDLKVGSKRAGKLLAEFFAKKSRQKIKPSFSVVGITRDGLQKKRFTFCVRL